VIGAKPVIGARDTLVELEVTGVGATGFANQLELKIAASDAEEKSPDSSAAVGTPIE